MRWAKVILRLRVGDEKRGNERRGCEIDAATERIRGRPRPVAAIGDVGQRRGIKREGQQCRCWV